jgi:hypothetical protein
MKIITIINDANDIIRTNGTRLGILLYDEVWQNYRFYPAREYGTGFSLGDIEEIIRILKEMRQ